MDTLYFTPKKIAKITGGYWENLNKKLQINEFHHTFHYLQEGDAFVVISDNWPNSKAYKPNEHKIQAAVKKGVSALIVRDDINIDVDIPVLRVENSYFAIKSLAKYASRHTKAKKVLISGSYGKTGFKTHLYQIIKDQINTYVRLNSANYAASSYCNLASIKEKNDLFLMEIPIAKRDKMTRRSRLVSPDIGVITSIGHEGIERWGTINRIIRYKLLIAKGLPKDGKLLLPYDDRYYSKILKEAKKYEDIEILTYGSHHSCNAYVLYKEYSEFGWDVMAKIENVVVAYRVPFFEEYAVSASVGVLLSAYHLGLDVHKAADRYYKNKNFKSSGIFYEIIHKNKKFYLYDQSNRGGIEGYESFFKTLSYVKPNKNGKKILVTSEFVDYEDGEMEFIDTKKFQKLIKESGIELLFSVEKFTEHINVLQDKSIWKNHSLDFNNIKDEILKSVENNDILAVKGIFESRLPKFIEYIKNMEGIKIKEFRSKNSMKEQNSALTGLRTLDISDLDNYKHHISNEKKSAWVYYFPFLYFWSLSPSRELLFGEEEGSIKLFLLNHLHREQIPHFHLYVPPIPFNSTVLTNCFDTISKYTGHETADIMWVDTNDLKNIRSDKKLKHVKFKFKEKEFIFDPKIYDDLSGTKFRNIRQQLNNVNKLKNVKIVPYELKYLQECRTLLSEWEHIKEKDDDDTFFEDSTYTRNCLEYAHLFNEQDLFGLVVLVDGSVKAFSFAGEIYPGYGNLFIGKTDLNIRGLHSFIKYHTLLRSQYCELMNDSSDLGDIGIKESKSKFRPVKMNKVYSAYADTKDLTTEIFNDKYEIKLAKETDLEDVHTIEMLLFNLADRTLSKEDFLDAIKKRSVYAVYNKDKKEIIVGYILLKEHTEYLSIDSIGVKYNYQNLGIGTQLLNFALKKAKHYNKSRISLEVNLKNKNAIKLYKRFGFKEVKLLKEFYLDKTDAYKMEYAL